MATVRGINLLSDRVTRKVKRINEHTKNELMRQIIQRCIQHPLLFRYVLMDNRFALSLDDKKTRVLRKSK